MYKTNVFPVSLGAFRFRSWELKYEVGLSIGSVAYMQCAHVLGVTGCFVIVRMNGCILRSEGIMTCLRPYRSKSAFIHLKTRNFTLALQT